MAKTVGELIKEARTNAKLTQEELARQVDGVSASDISKAERGEKELTQAALKQIAKATGVTQKSLLEAAAAPAKKSTSSSKSGTSGKKNDSASKTTSSGKQSSSKKTDDEAVKLTAAEKRMLDLYRKADANTKKAAEALLKGEKTTGEGNAMESLLGSAIELLTGIK